MSEHEPRGAHEAVIIPSMVQGDFDKAAASREAVPPTIPDVLLPGTLRDLVAADEVEVRNLDCTDEAALEESFTELEVEGARFSHCRYAGCDLTQSIFRDVAFEDCDFSNAKMDSTGFVRCSFTSCKLTGASFLESSFEDVRLKDCSLSYSALTQSRWKHMALHGCDLTGADMAEMEQRFVRVSECRFADTSFFRTHLAGIDFTTSLLENVTFSDSMTEFYGAKLNVYQAASLARCLGIIVEE